MRPEFSSCYLLCDVPDGAGSGAFPRQCWPASPSGWLHGGDNLSHGHDLPRLILQAGLTRQQAADVLGVSARTLQRWIGTKRPHPTAWRLLRILAGELPWPGWHGWVCHNGFLLPPGWQRRGFRPAEIETCGLQFQLAESRRQTIERLEADNHRLRAELRRCLDARRRRA